MNVTPSRGARLLGVRARTVALLATVALLPALSLAVPAASQGVARAVSTTGSLTVSPSSYVAGQAVHFKGNIGRAGVRAVHLQSFGNRPGSEWMDVPNSGFRTNANGSFDYVFTAPSMFRISYRVVGGGLATNSYLFTATPQEITLSLPTSDPERPFHTVAPLLPFTVVADTTPNVRSNLGVPPAFPGWEVALQERVGGNRWQTIETAETDAQGLATFRVNAPAVGTRVLRARQERWTEGRNEIGWYASFPAYFSVLGVRDKVGTTHAARTAATSEPVARTTTTTAARSEVRPTAAEKYLWGATIFDFAWERGQDLDSRPSKGTRMRGSWVDTSDGTGRATPYNGALVLQSKLRYTGEGDLGTTTATLTGNSQARGRWEIRLQGRVFERGARPYRFLLELVPQGSPVDSCLPESVVMADFTLGEPGMGIGVRSKADGAIWRRNVSDIRLAEMPFNVAVEIGQGHVTWFVDGRPVGTVKSAQAAKVAGDLVPRLSLVGGQQEQNGAQVNSDWQRAWTLDRGRQVKSGAALTRSAWTGC